MAFNTGTPGPEQKITALGINKNQTFFLKFAQTTLAKQNVQNEYLILKQIQQFDFVPKILRFQSKQDFVLLMTSVFNGRRLTTQDINNQLINLLVQIGSQELKTINNYNSSLRTCFAHGDLCPWNMILDNGKLKIYDWEMAGNYPLGYDLFTFIFQTAFLLTPKNSLKTLISKKQKLINTFFSKLGIKDWSPYLVEFASIKFELEIKKKVKD